MTTTTKAGEHLSHRPDWRCRLCRRPWPCDDAKADLLDEFRVFPSVLTIYLSAQLYDALFDLTRHGEPAPINLYERFLSWTRPHAGQPGPDNRRPPATRRKSKRVSRNSRPRLPEQPPASPSPAASPRGAASPRLPRGKR